MFLDFFRITGMGNSLLLIDLVSRVLFIVFCALILLILGYKIRRSLAAGFMLFYGFFVYMCNFGLLRF